jgi:hypothetical protein
VICNLAFIYFFSKNWHQNLQDVIKASFILTIIVMVESIAALLFWISFLQGLPPRHSLSSKIAMRLFGIFQVICGSNFFTRAKPVLSQPFFYLLFDFLQSDSSTKIFKLSNLKKSSLTYFLEGRFKSGALFASGVYLSILPVRFSSPIIQKIVMILFMMVVSSPT